MYRTFLSLTACALLGAQVLSQGQPAAQAPQAPGRPVAVEQELEWAQARPYGW